MQLVPRRIELRTTPRKGVVLPLDYGTFQNWIMKKLFKVSDIKNNMGRKRVIKIPKNAKIKCPNCNKISLRKVPEKESPQYFDCDKCSKRTQAPITSCCIICAFTKTKCVPSLLLEAKSKNLKII